MLLKTYTLSKVLGTSHFRATRGDALTMLRQVGTRNEKKKTNPVNQNQGWEPIHQKYKAKKENTKENWDASCK
jgi:hypothetical protein